MSNSHLGDLDIAGRVVLGNCWRKGVYGFGMGWFGSG